MLRRIGARAAAFTLVCGATVAMTFGGINSAAAASVDTWPIGTSSAGWQLTVGPDDKVYFTTLGGVIGRFDPATHAIITIAVGGTPNGITVGPDNAIWFTQQSAHQIGRVDLGFTNVSYYGNANLAPGVGGLNQPANLLTGADNQLYVTNYSGPGSVTRFNVSTSTFDASWTLGSDYQTDGITRLGNDIYVVTENGAGDAHIGGVWRITPAGATTRIGQFPDMPTQITAAHDGSLWVSRFGADAIGRITPAGTYLPDIAVGNGPTGIARGDNGSMWVAHAFDGIAEVTANATVQMHTTNTAWYFNDVAANSAGHAFFISTGGHGGHRIGRVIPGSQPPTTTTAPTTTAPTTTQAPPTTTAPTTTAPEIGGTQSELGDGYRLVASDGGIFAFGASPFLGSTGAMTLNQPIVAAASTPTRHGYWLIAADGGVFSFGNAKFYGSTGAMTLNQPIVAAASTPTGDGYWLIAADGGVFSFGDAKYHGSTGGIALNQPIVDAAAAPNGAGYWLVARDGGVFSFGSATYLGSNGGEARSHAAVAIDPNEAGSGYRIGFANGEVTVHGTAPDLGGLAGTPLARPLVTVID